jgi:predicted enzyme related to lactoylglutathione lyase
MASYQERTRLRRSCGNVKRDARGTTRCNRGGRESRIGGFQPLSFTSDDVFATAAAMKSKGVEFFAEPKKESWGTSAIFKDPDGNQYVLSSR